MHRLRSGLAAVLVVACWSGSSDALTVIDFEGFAHGEIITTDITGLTVGVSNVGGGPDLGVIFDTSETATSDVDLEGPPNSSWSGGNLGANVVLNNVLIIQENSTGCGDGVCDDPDDEGSRPAGTITLDFGNIITIGGIGFDILDIEGSQEDGALTFALGGVNIATVGFMNFTNGSAFNVTGFQFGNHTANRVPTNTFASLNLGGFNRVIFNLGGSGAIDNLMIPEPTSMVLLGFSLLGLCAGARWHGRRP